MAPNPKALAVTLAFAIVSTVLTAEQGWFASNAGESCDDACTGKEACHLATLQSIDTKVDLSQIPLPGFESNGVSDPEDYCSYPRAYNPSMDSDGCSKFMNYNGRASTCAAKAEGIIRACCCSNAGCSLGPTQTGTANYEVK